MKSYAKFKAMKKRVFFDILNRFDPTASHQNICPIESKGNLLKNAFETGFLSHVKIFLYSNLVFF